MKNSTAIILILISFGLLYTFFMPQYEKSKVLGAEKEQYQAVLNDASAISETSDRLEIELSGIPPSEVEKLTKILPDNVDTVRLAMDLDSIASKYGVSITNVEVDSMDDSASAIVQNNGSPYERVTISFRFVANYESFRNFIEDVERSLRIIDVRTISFRTAESGFYEYRMEIETYWVK